MFQQLTLGNSSLMDSSALHWRLENLHAVRGTSAQCQFWGLPEIPEEGPEDRN